jgi:glucosamine 6-phosphate synthetase-like amidotransferase/phosphosugar isomerase protein
MAKVTKTYNELLMLVNAINILSGNKEEVTENNKGIKKLQKIGTKMKEHLDAYNEKVEDIRLDNAHTDEKGCLILDEKGGYKYSKDGLKKMNKDIKALLEKEFEFYQFTFSNDGIENYAFLEGWVEGLVFPKDDVEELEVV